MCGIWFLITKDNIDSLTGQAFEAFLKIKHRGPDYSKFEILHDLNAIIGFHRLSINGLSKYSANQPFVYDEDDTLTFAMCNGEIYNYEELAKQYEIDISSGSDCEILYPLYKKIGMHRLMNEINAEASMMFIKYDKKTKKVNLTVGRGICGTRPLSIAFNNNEICFASEKKALLHKHLHDNDFMVQQFPPRHYLELSSDDDFIKLNFTEYFNFAKIPITITNKEEGLEFFRKHERACVKSRLKSDAPIAFANSGGKDSATIIAHAQQIMKDEDGLRYQPPLTFCIGVNKNSTDVKAAQFLADELELNHHTIILPENDFVNAIPDVIYSIESFDVTTVRASVGQYLLAKSIAKSHPHVKVLIVGDIADELFGSYLYMLKAKSHEIFHNEVLKLMNNINFFDVARCSESTAAHSIECRTAYEEFTKYYLQLDIELRHPNDGIEKSFAREAHDGRNFLPPTINRRKKEAFSDGVSTVTRSLYEIFQEKANSMYTDEEFERLSNMYTHMKPLTKEALYYRQIFEGKFGTREIVAKTIPYFWLPNPDIIGYVETDPSARKLAELYND